MKIGQTIYLDHQASTPLDPRVFEAMRPYFQDSVGNPHASEHIFGWRSMQAIEKAANQVAELIGSDSDEIIFTSGATESNNLALSGIAKYASRGERKRILISAIEHKCIFEITHYLHEAFGYMVTQIPVNSIGQLDMQVLEQELGNDVLLLSVMPVNNEIGTIQDIPAISGLAKSHGILIHCDAAQSPCAIDLSKFADHVDLISLSGHKIYGPMGIGALYVSRELHKHLSPVIYGGGQQDGLRSGTLPTALCVGLGSAAELLLGPAANIERESLALSRNLFEKHLKSLPYGIWVNGPEYPENRHPGNINVGFKDVNAADLLNRVQPYIAASSGSACTSGIPEPSHVLRSIGLKEKDSYSSVRFSLGRYTKEEDIKEAMNHIDMALKQEKENHLIPIQL
ncbi:MAG: cysteine desulfurase family protein [Gammaproteobacteria bacterium]|nr:cysteine desulfurase family protein [Gammaproteobacteria bacterium]